MEEAGGRLRARKNVSYVVDSEDDDQDSPPRRGGGGGSGKAAAAAVAQQPAWRKISSLRQGAKAKQQTLQQVVKRSQPQRPKREASKPSYK